MGRVHEPWGNVMEPLLLKDYCTYNYTNYNEILHNCYQLFISVSKFSHVI